MTNKFVDALCFIGVMAILALGFCGLWTFIVMVIDALVQFYA